ncbi:MAG: diaminopimelate epimerase [Neisseria sp.]|nr:diaminopimelate epimerase [Neisseria sp.]
MTVLKFTKMHGLGNDFMVIDAVNQTFDPLAAPIAQWADRHTGIGFDQLLVVEKTEDRGVDFRYRIFNADGGEVGQCGNGARCFARFVADKGLSAKREIRVATAGGIIVPKLMDDGRVRVNMGRPRFAPAEIPFLPVGGGTEGGVYRIPAGGGEAEFGCVNMGNPHAVLLVDDADTAPVASLGAQLEGHECFPERVNVGFMQIMGKNHIRLRVYERGVGETQACGTGACAAAVSGIRRGLLDGGKPVRVDLPGGTLFVEYAGQDVLMTGPAQTVFEGEVAY